MLRGGGGYFQITHPDCVNGMAFPVIQTNYARQNFTCCPGGNNGWNGDCKSLSVVVKIVLVLMMTEQNKIDVDEILFFKGRTFRFSG